ILRTSEVDPRWIFNLVRATNFVKAMSDLVQGALYPAVRSKDIRGFEAPFAPLNEQKRIADKLDSIFARVDACRERLDRIPVILKHFRQAVLAAATSGKLTEEWRENCSLSFNWPQVKLADVASSRLGKMLDKNKNQGELIPYLRNINVRWFDFNLNDIQKIQVSLKEKNELNLRSGDVMICEGGEPGRCAVWRETASNFVYQKALHRVRVSDQLLPKYLCYVIKAAADDHSLAKLFTGTTIKHLTGISLNRFAFLLPPLQEQTEIVRRVEELFAYADRIEARYHAARAQVDKLTPAILAKAFRGELVPQDPNDEPASVLLDRIRASRAENALTPKPKRSRKLAAK
ncbi:MAG: restriction endonuclease subunit S, partial [Nitrosomonas sp.]|nr:restriction endonuclease subunit S [Nitrosomonas sp.]